MMDKDLCELRKELDEIDTNMCKLFVKRMEIIDKIKEFKERNDIPILDKKREDTLINKHINDIPFKYKDSYYLFISNILEISKKYQEKR